MWLFMVPEKTEGVCSQKVLCYFFQWLRRIVVLLPIDLRESVSEDLSMVPWSELNMEP